MITSDIIRLFIDEIIKSTRFGWTLILKPEFGEYTKILSQWVVQADKDFSTIKSDMYAPLGEILSLEITRTVLQKTHNVYNINDSLFKQFFSATSLLSYVLTFDYLSGYDISKFRHVLKFVLSNTPNDLEQSTRLKIKDLLIDRWQKYTLLKNRKEWVSLDDVFIALSFYDKIDLLSWLKALKLPYQLKSSNEGRENIYFYV